MTPEQREALRRAVDAFTNDRDARNDALKTRRDFIKACAQAHSLGISDQMMANSFKRVALDAFSRARIQQLRTKESS